ncbi:MAG: hypothetical protein OXU79_15395 [Gemmatimonadota bacterium]|nr:hypothetical protein [Gemmatimonadota bacterium]
MDQFNRSGNWDDSEYRVIRKRHIALPVTTHHICRVNYDLHGKIASWSDDLDELYGETLNELREEIRHVLRAFCLPVLEEKSTAEGLTLVRVDSREISNEGLYADLFSRASLVVEFVHQFVGIHPIPDKNAFLRLLYARALKALYRFRIEARRLDRRNR